MALIRAAATGWHSRRRPAECGTDPKGVWEMPPSSVHFNGSVNLTDAETVMREIASRVPIGLRRLPDGETGDRGRWILFQLGRLLQSPAFVKVTDGGEPGDFEQLPLVRLADGVTPDSLRWPDLGYASAYARSYEIFSRLTAEGIIPSGVRFQVEYPTPLAPVRAWIAASQHDELLGSYERALFSDLQRLLALVPHDRVAVQWDVAVEIGILEGARGTPPAGAFGGIVAGLARCIGQVPNQIPAGLHLCYGDYGHRHLVEPRSLAMQVRLLNEVTAAAPRAVSFAALTVPQYRRDGDYFAPLRELRADDRTELYFAIVPYHPAEQEPGTTAEQIRLIDRFLAESTPGMREWGICTECGMGRVEPQDVSGLLDLHREILAAY
jgi:hypothetical protein